MKNVHSPALEITVAVMMLLAVFSLHVFDPQSSVAQQIMIIILAFWISSSNRRVRQTPPINTVLVLFVLVGVVVLDIREHGALGRSLHIFMSPGIVFLAAVFVATSAVCTAVSSAVRRA